MATATTSDALQGMDRDALVALLGTKPELAPQIIAEIERRSAGNGSSITAQGVRVLKTGRIRIRHGAQVDLTAAQVCVVLAHADELQKELRKVNPDKCSETVCEGRNGDAYSEFRSNGILIGTNTKHQNVVKQFKAQHKL